MKSLAEDLARYAAYHRDARNRATHYVGIPLIVFAVAVLLSRPQWQLGGIRISPAVIGAAGSIVYYFLRDAGLGLLMAPVLGLALWLGAWVALQGTSLWLAVGLGTLAVGWACQFVGHFFEGRKPAFLDDLASLLIGPLFVLAEALFALGFYRALRAELAVRAAR